MAGRRIAGLSTPKTVRHIHNQQEYSAAIRSGSVAIEFSATWCPPSREIEPVFEELANQNKGITFLHVDVDECKDISRSERIEAMPTFVFYVNGKAQDNLRLRGANERKLREAISQLPKKSAFNGEGYSLGGSSKASSTPDDLQNEIAADSAPKPPKRRRNPWADPDFAKNKMGVRAPPPKAPQKPKKQTKKAPTILPETNVSAWAALKERTKAKEDAPKSANEADSGFKYAKQLAAIRAKGYTEKEFPDGDVMEALVSCKGNVENAIEEISELD